MEITQQIFKVHLGNSDIEWVAFTLQICTNSEHGLSQGDSRGEHRMFLHWWRPRKNKDAVLQSRGSHTIQPLLTPAAQDRCCQAALTVLSWDRLPIYSPQQECVLSLGGCSFSLHRGHSCSPLRPHNWSLLWGKCLRWNLSPTFQILLFSSEKGFTVYNHRSTHGRPLFLTVLQTPCGPKQCTEVPWGPNCETEYSWVKYGCWVSICG